MDKILLVPVFLPLIAGFVLLFLPNKLRLKTNMLTLAISAVTFVLSISIFADGKAEYAWSILELPETLGGLELQLLLKAGPLGAFILMFAMGFGFLISLYSLKSVGKDTLKANEYFGSMLLAIGGSAGILLCNHLLFLLIFWEIVTVSLYLLITTGGKNTNFAATKSYIMIGVSDAAFMFGILAVWVISGTFVISEINLPTNTALSVIAFLLLMTAAITKAGAMPLHTWLPTSGEYAPASVMALLPAAIDKLLGIYLLVVVTWGMFVIKQGILTTILAIIGTATIIIAVMVAMVQHNLKKLLSYHAISQVGYMVLGIATGTPVGIAGGLLHMLNHAIYKCCLFLCGGAVEQATGTANLDRLGGLGKKMPITFSACLVAALSISGVPPFNGFVSKWMVYQGVINSGTSASGWHSGLWPLWLSCAMFGSALTLASFVKLIHSMFLSRLPDDLQKVKEVPAVQTIPMAILALLCVLFGIFYTVPLNHFIYPALNALGINTDNVIIGTWQSGLATILILAGIGIGVLIWIAGKLSKNIRVVPTWTCGEVQKNDEMIIPGTHFYKTVSEMTGLKKIYKGQEKGYFDLYDQCGRCGLTLTALLKWLHSGVLPVYLTWITLGTLIVLFVVCKIW